MTRQAAKAKKAEPITANKEEPARITVRIGAFPGGQIKPYSFEADSTYQDGLKEANLAGSGGDEQDVRVNGTTLSSLTAKMRDGDQILVFSKVRGN